MKKMMMMNMMRKMRKKVTSMKSVTMRMMTTTRRMMMMMMMMDDDSDVSMARLPLYCHCIVREELSQLLLNCNYQCSSDDRGLGVQGFRV